MKPEDVRRLMASEPFESMVARGIAGLEMLLREAVEDES